MIELTLEQVRAIALAGTAPTLIDPTTRQVYVLVPAQGRTAAASGPAIPGVGAGPAQESEAGVETTVEPWRYLVVRKHPWRKQLYIKGRNMTVRQLVGGIKANKLTEEQAAANYHLPVEAIREAVRYFEENPEVIDLDAAHERYLENFAGEAVALKLYLDDCANADLLADLLTGTGHTVVRPGDVGMLGAADDAHFACAAANGLVVVTKNPHDFHDLHYINQNHAGIFAIYQDNDPTRDMTDLEIVAAIGRIEAAIGYPIAGGFHNLNAWR